MALTPSMHEALPFRHGATANSMIRTASGRTLAYSEAGSGPDVVLLHGTLTTSDDMRLALFEDLARDFHVVALDRPSHGLSDRVPLADASLWSQASIIRDAALALDLQRPLICGHSYGGSVAVAMGLAYPEAVSGVVALAPICFPEPRLEQALFGPRAFTGRRLEALLDPLLLPVLWNAMFLPQVMPDRFAARFPFGLAGRPEQIVAEGEGANCLWSDLSRSAVSYPTCRVPVHFVAGSSDIVVNPLHSVIAASMMPSARLQILPGVGHMLHHTRSDVVAECIAALASRAAT